MNKKLKRIVNRKQRERHYFKLWYRNSDDQEEEKSEEESDDGKKNIQGQKRKNEIKKLNKDKK